MRRLLFVCLALLALASSADAQTIVDKVDWEFAPSPDHNATNLAGQPKVTGYEVDVVTFVAQTVVIRTLTVAKTANAGGKMQLTLPADLVKETVLLMKARAVGQAGLLSAYGPTSDPFGQTGPAVAPAPPGKPSPKP